jgi:hypothetical protein
VTTSAIVVMTTTYRLMEQSPSPQRVPEHFKLVARSDDLGRFYGQTEGVTPFSEADGSGTSQTRASEPPKGGTIINLNISAVAHPSLTLETIDPNPNGLRIRSPRQNPNPNGSPLRVSPLGNRVIHWVIWLTSSYTRCRVANVPWGAMTNTRLPIQFNGVVGAVPRL